MEAAPPEVTAVVLCGGTSARMGGSDKTALDLDGRSVLGVLVESLPAEWHVVCVGEERPLPRSVVWTREDPPLGGPVAGLAAGVTATVDDCEVVAVLAGDQPFAGPAVVRCAEVLVGSPDLDGVCARQDDGRIQPLLGAYRRRPLGQATTTAARGTGVYRALAGLDVVGVDTDAHATLDVDTPADLDDARRHASP